MQRNVSCLKLPISCGMLPVKLHPSKFLKGKTHTIRQLYTCLFFCSSPPNPKKKNVFIWSLFLQNGELLQISNIWGSSFEIEEAMTYRYVKAESCSMALLNVPATFMLDNLLQLPGNSIPGFARIGSCPALRLIPPILHQCLKCGNC